MYTYLKVQEAPITDNITADGHVGARLPWPVIADADGIVTIPSSAHYVRAIGFQKDLAVQQVDLRWVDAFADPAKAVGMYLVMTDKGGQMQGSLSAVDTAELLEMSNPLPVER